MGRSAAVQRQVSLAKKEPARCEWIHQAIAANMPYDKFAYAVLTASGSNLENPPASYYKILREPGPLMENNTQLFLAMRFNCNTCHDHPFERWTQSQHWKLAAYFANVARKDDPQIHPEKIGETDVEQGHALGEIIYDGHPGEVRNPTTRSCRSPNSPIPMPACPRRKGTLREQFARWTVSPKNPYFAKSYVNRLWSYLTGVGIIEPVDDLRAGNPPTNPALLDRLTAEFIASGFNVQEMQRLICKSPRISFRSPRTSGTPTTRSTIRTPSPAGCRPKCCTTPMYPGDRLDAPSSAAAARGAGRRGARSERQLVRQFFGSVRPRGAAELLRMRTFNAGVMLGPGVEPDQWPDGRHALTEAEQRHQLGL